MVVYQRDIGDNMEGSFTASEERNDGPSLKEN